MKYVRISSWLIKRVEFTIVLCFKNKIVWNVVFSLVVGAICRFIDCLDKDMHRKYNILKYDNNTYLVSTVEIKCLIFALLIYKNYEQIIIICLVLDAPSFTIIISVRRYLLPDVPSTFTLYILNVFPIKIWFL